MKILLALFLTLPLAALPAEPKPEEAKPAAEEKKAEAAAPAAEKNVSGSIEFGYRWVGDLRGSHETYRSLVNLDQGPRVFDVDLTLQDPSKRLFDRVDLSAAGWGGEPHSSIRVDARKSGVYRLLTDYRNLA
ncbi:MAG: hypothetical protein AAB654_26185, partial [Acidobacteriota bacterium]